jgi:outer membrane autotransporter protein
MEYGAGSGRVMDVDTCALNCCQASRIFREQPCRRANGSRPYGLPLPKRRLHATAVLASAALNLAARIAIPVIVLNGVSGVASAQDATWAGPNPDWNTSANWNPATVPGPNGTATFGGALPTSISMAGGVAVGTLQFNAPNYTFDVLGLTINGTGVNASLANAPTFNVIGTPAQSTPAIDFNNSSSAGTAKFILGQIIDTNNGFNAGFINFFGSSTAGQATITVRDASATNFFSSSTAGQATLIVENGGFVGFQDTSNGDQAKIINNAGGEVKIADLTTGGTSFGSIAGAGTYNLGSKQLTVGSNGDSTTVSGVIEDHFPGASGDVGGSLVKVGTGTLTLSGANTYTGLTTISEGAINLTGSLLSPVSVEASGTLGSTGTVFNTVTNAGTVAPGFGLPATQFGTLTVNSYVGAGGTLALRTFLGTDGSPSDKLVINGGTATGSTSVRITNAGGPGAETVANGITVVQAINGGTTAAGAFTLPGEVRAGDFDYRLFHGGLSGSNPNDWFLRSTFIVGPVPPEPVVPPEPPILPPEPPVPPEALPPGVYPIIGPEIATYGVVQPIARQLGMTTLGTLHERTGDPSLAANTGTPCVTDGGTPDGIPRKAPAKAPTDCLNAGWRPSVWGRVLGQQIDNHYRAFADPRASGQLLGFQSGIDLLRGEWLPGHRDAAGIYVGYANANVDVSGLVTNEAATGYVLRHTGGLNLDAWSGGAYWTHYGPSDWYLDAVAQVTHYQGAASTQFASLATTGFGFLSSLETGFPVRLPMFGPGFVLEPQAQIVWQRVSFDDANDGLGAVALGTTSGASGRIGLRGKWTIVSDSGQVWQPYLRANLWRDWGARATATYSGVDLVPLLEQATRLQLGGGLSVRMNANVSLYANADYQFAVGDTDGGRRNGIRGAAGVRYTW